MRAVYGPLGNAANTNSPLASLTPSRDTPVPSWVASTLAPGMTAAELSRTRPTSVAVVTCASTWFDPNSKRAVMQTAMAQAFATVVTERNWRRGTSCIGPTSRPEVHACLRTMVIDFGVDFSGAGLYTLLFSY